MTDPADPRDEQNRGGGWYELAVELATHDRAVVDGAFRELSRLAGVEQVEGGHVLRLPDGPRVVCAFAEVGEDEGTTWVVLGLPTGSLVRADPRVGGHPFGDDAGTGWSGPLDAWLVSLAVRLCDAAPVVLALVGHEVSGTFRAAELAGAPPDEHYGVGILVVEGGPAYHPPTA